MRASRKRPRGPARTTMLPPPRGPARPTAGPWSIERAPNGHAMAIHGDRRHVVNRWGITRPASPEGEANALLIAAAPALLEACQVALHELVEIDNDPDVISILAKAIESAGISTLGGR